MSAAASPPAGSPPQYSPALRWVTTGFGMGPGGASALSATGTPHPPRPGRRERLDAPPLPACAIARAGSSGEERAPARPARLTAVVSGPTREGRDARGAHPSAADRWRACAHQLWEVRPRPLGRLGSSRLPAVHLPPIDPVICRGPYLVYPVGRLVLGRDSRLDAFSGSPGRTWLPSGAGCPTTGSPAVRPPRSSRTRGSPPQPPIARGG